MTEKTNVWSLYLKAFGDLFNLFPEFETPSRRPSEAFVCGTCGADFVISDGSSTPTCNHENPPARSGLEADRENLLGDFDWMKNLGVSLDSWETPFITSPVKEASMENYKQLNAELEDFFDSLGGVAKSNEDLLTEAAIWRKHGCTGMASMLEQEVVRDIKATEDASRIPFPDPLVVKYVTDGNLCRPEPGIQDHWTDFQKLRWWAASESLVYDINFHVEDQLNGKFKVWSDHLYLGEHAFQQAWDAINASTRSSGKSFGTFFQTLTASEKIEIQDPEPDEVVEEDAFDALVETPHKDHLVGLGICDTCGGTVRRYDSGKVVHIYGKLCVPVEQPNPKPTPEPHVVTCTLCLTDVVDGEHVVSKDGSCLGADNVIGGAEPCALCNDSYWWFVYKGKTAHGRYVDGPGGWPVFNREACNSPTSKPAEESLPTMAESVERVITCFRCLADTVRFNDGSTFHVDSVDGECLGVDHVLMEEICPEAGCPAFLWKLKGGSSGHGEIVNRRLTKTICTKWSEDAVEEEPSSPWKTAKKEITCRSCLTDITVYEDDTSVHHTNDGACLGTGNVVYYRSCTLCFNAVWGLKVGKSGHGRFVDGRLIETPCEPAPAEESSLPSLVRGIHTCNYCLQNVVFYKDGSQLHGDNPDGECPGMDNRIEYRLCDVDGCQNMIWSLKQGGSGHGRFLDNRLTEMPCNF